MTCLCPDSDTADVQMNSLQMPWSHVLSPFMLMKYSCFSQTVLPGCVIMCFYVYESRSCPSLRWTKDLVIQGLQRALNPRAGIPPILP